MQFIKAKFCSNCGIRLPLTKQRQKFCSMQCRGLSMRTREEICCKKCGRKFQAHQSEIKRGGGKYCSRRCYHDDQPSFDPCLYFWPKIKVSDTGCHLWHGALKNGYGIIGINDKCVLTHRLSYSLAYGPIPPGLQINHTCDIRNCVNPEHLYAGTAKENTNDMVSRNRGALFEPRARHPRARLTPEQVVAIRASTAPASALAQQFGVTGNHIWRIRNNIKWREM